MNMGKLLRFPFLILATLLATHSQAVESSNESDIIRIISKSLAWEKRWYGTYYGEKCLNKTSNRKAILHVITDRTDNLVGYKCSDGTPIKERSQTFIAYLQGSNIVFGGSTTPNAESAVIAAGSEQTCAVDEDDVVELIHKAKRGQSAFIPLKFQWGTDNTDEPKEVNSDVAAYIQRSFKLWKTGGGASRKQTENMILVSIGQTKSSDTLVPLLFDDQSIQLISIPEKSRILDQDFCGVLYSSDRYSGRDLEAKKNRFAMNSHLKKAIVDQNNAVK